MEMQRESERKDGDLSQETERVREKEKITKGENAGYHQKSVDEREDENLTRGRLARAMLEP